jgi:hypothetical protein
MDMIRCPRCAREIPDFSRFCRRCVCAIVWRGQVGAAVTIPTIPAQSDRPTMLGSARQVKTAKPASPPPTRVKPSVRTAGSGGAGIFAIFAAAGLVCFVNYHAVMRPMSAPRVRYPQTPSMRAMPAEPEEVSSPFVAPLPPPSYPPPSYPVPLRSNASSGYSRRYVPQPPPTMPMPRTAGALRTPDGIIVMPPDRYGSSPRNERDRDR